MFFHRNIGKCKGKVHLYSATIATYTVSAALSSQTEPACNLGRSPSSRSRTLTYNHTAIRSRSLPFNGLHCVVSLVHDAQKTEYT